MFTEQDFSEEPGISPARFIEHLQTAERTGDWSFAQLLLQSGVAPDVRNIGSAYVKEQLVIFETKLQVALKYEAEHGEGSLMDTSDLKAMEFRTWRLDYLARVAARKASDCMVA